MKVVFHLVYKLQPYLQKVTYFKEEMRSYSNVIMVIKYTIFDFKSRLFSYIFPSHTFNFNGPSEIIQMIN